mmetsp:Transcript_3004/g.5350  ORF Transcript_3004/g.5350 Transcript_3004/m.5350 type:complete len:658 (-) Transcript_3004:195-2168(-)
MAPDAPKIGSSGNKTANMNNAAGKSQSTLQTSDNMEDRTSDRAGGKDNLVWEWSLDKVNQAALSQITSKEHESNGRWDTKGIPEENNSNGWWDTEGILEENKSNGGWDTKDIPEEEAQMHSREWQGQERQSQEQQDIEYARGASGIDSVGGLQMECEQPASAISYERSIEIDPTENLSLWQTFKVLYRQNPMMKYYILMLVILLIATAAIIGVATSQKKKSPSEDCDASSYTDTPFLILPGESEDVRSGGFGTSISASLEYLIIGAPNPACKPQGSTCDNIFTIGGGAFLYRRDNENEWALHSSFVLNDGVSYGDQFGESVAISEDSTTVVVGAPKDDKHGIVAGAIYVMEEPFAITTPPIRLVSDDMSFNDGFGGSVSVSATTVGGDDSPIRVTNVVAGAPFDDDFGSKSGGVYVFAKFDGNIPDSPCGAETRIEAGKWIQCKKLLPDDGGTNDLFGKVVDIAGRTIVVGAMWDDDKGIDSGAAYVFSLDDGGNWSFQQKLHSTNFQSRASRFGVSVATSGGRIVVGADLDDSSGDDSGAAYIFLLSNGAWKFESKLIPTIVAGGHRDYACGFNVDISNDGHTVVVGCPGAPGGGVAYVYNLQETGMWVETDKLTVPDGYSGTDLRLGGSVTSSGEMAVVGYGVSKGDVFSYKKSC